MEYKIGAFADMCRVTVRALHHYERMGLLAPSRVDPDTGYRYYREEQSGRLDWIVTLKELGFSLQETAAFLEEGSAGRLVGMLEHKHAQCLRSIDRAKTQRIGLEALLALIRKTDTGLIDLMEVNPMELREVRNMLPDTEVFLEDLDKALKRAGETKTPLSLIGFDLDRFARINELYGRKAGDAVMEDCLRIAAEKIGDVRPLVCAKDLLCRKGGDEYLILLADRPPESAAEYARSIAEAIRGHDFSAGGCAETVTATFGVANSRDTASADEIIRRVETALYRGKQHEKGGVTCWAG